MASVLSGSSASSAAYLAAFAARAKTLLARLLEGLLA
jgi:hypothetical protein